MKALLLTAGKGTRLRPLTYTRNKQAIPVANKPMILYPFENIVEAGIKEIGVVVSGMRSEIEEILGNGEKWDVRITYILQKHQKGAAHALSLAEDFIGTDKFIFVLGDNISQYGFKKELKAFAKNDANGHLMGIKIPQENHSRMGMATVDVHNQVVAFLEKPGIVDKSEEYVPERSYSVTGYFMADQNIFKSFHGKDAIKPSVRGELENPHAYRYLIEHGYKVTLSEVKGWWIDSGSPEDILMTNRLVLSQKKKFKNEGIIKTSKIDGNVEIGKDSIIENSIIHGPVVIGKNVRIKNCTIGSYTSINDGCKLLEMKIENSILLPNIIASGVPLILEGCVIGSDTEISGNKKASGKTTFILGDKAKVIV
jgi:glucose-1-phosphate thymidylyltransferase